MNSGTLDPAALSALRVRVRTPFFTDGFAFDDSASISKRIPIDPASTRHELDAEKCGLCFTQTVKSPHAQL